MKLTQITNESMILDYQEGNRREWYETALKNLESYKDEGELTATEHKEMRERFGRGFDTAWNKHVREPHINSGRWESIPQGPIYDFFMLDASPQVHTSPGKLKKLKKLAGQHPAVDAAIEVLEDIVPIALEIKELKGKIVKKKRAVRDKEEAAASEQRVMLGSDDVQRVRHALEQITDDLKQDLYKNNLSWLNRIVEKWADQYDPKNEKTEPYDFYRDSNPFGFMILQRVTKRTGRYGEETFDLNDNYKEYLDKEAQKMSQDMMDKFVYKNTQKLAEILVKKGGLKEVQLRDARTDSGTIEGTLRLEFKDGSSFIVTSGLVWSWSKHGKQFTRYPTTFHNVIYSDGSKMHGRASEARMKDEFVNHGK